MNEKLFPQDGEFSLETFNEMSERYVGFGQNLFRKLMTDVPKLIDHIKFYKRIDIEQEDSYAIISNPKISIAIQLDPECEVIVIWNKNIHIEKGHWTVNLIDETIDSINTLLHQQN